MAVLCEPFLAPTGQANPTHAPHRPQRQRGRRAAPSSTAAAREPVASPSAPAPPGAARRPRRSGAAAASGSRGGGAECRVAAGVTADADLPLDPVLVRRQVVVAVWASRPATSRRARRRSTPCASRRAGTARRAPGTPGFRRRPPGVPDRGALGSAARRRVRGLPGAEGPVLLPWMRCGGCGGGRGPPPAPECASLDQQHAGSGLGQHAGSHPAAGPGAEHDHVLAVAPPQPARWCAATGSTTGGPAPSGPPGGRASRADAEASP